MSNPRPRAPCTDRALHASVLLTLDRGECPRSRFQGLLLPNPWPLRQARDSVLGSSGLPSSDKSGRRERAAGPSPVSPHASRPLGIPPGPAPLNRPPANARRKARRRFRRPARSGHGNHPWPDGGVHARAATALQRTPPPSAWCRPGSLLAAHSQSRAFEAPGGPRSEERTRHRLITPAARDLPLLAVPFVRTVTSLGHRSSVHRFPRGGVCTRTPVRVISAERTQKLPLTHRPTALLRGSAPSPFRFTAKPSRASHG